MPRGGLKRKRVAEEEELVKDLDALIHSHIGKRPQQSVGAAGEDDAWALECLKLRHNGNTNAAQLNLMVELSAGRGEHPLFSVVSVWVYGYSLD